MIKKKRKFICIGICFLFFLFFCFFCLPINKVSAGLEVQYPVISGQTLTPNSTLPSYVKYLFNAGMFLGFFAVLISLVIAGIMYFLSPVNAELLASAKDRISGAISGLLILVLTYLIVATINPQLSFFNLSPLPPTPPPPVAPPPPGVYLYSQTDCSNTRVQANTSSISDLGD
jgi:hypothetical protein